MGGREKAPATVIQDDAVVLPNGDLINASGHKQELERNFSLFSVCATGVVVGNTWVALGGSLVVAIYNGGPPGVIYEFIAASVFYWMIAACLAELASAMPSSGGVYHWATVTAGKHGRVTGYFAGWWNFFSWILGAAATSSIIANQTISMWALMHPGYEAQPWHVFVCYLLWTWLCCFTVMFANRALPVITKIGGFFIVSGVFIVIVVAAVMPHVNGTGYASNEFVWKTWTNSAGYSSDGFVFVAGMLNGAFAVGTPDCVSHLAEEIARPSRSLPKAMLVQNVVGFFTAFFYMTAIFYSISDLDAIYEQTSTFPLAYIYRQSTGSNAGAVGLVIVNLLPALINNIGCYINCGRTFWSLSRDKATPFCGFFGKVHPVFHNPFNATLLCGIICTLLGCIYLGNAVAFNAFIGSYVILSTLSYLAALLPHLLSGRSNVVPGWFWMPSILANALLTISCLYIVAFIVIFCFPAAMPFDASTMNYSSLITGGLTIFVGLFWFWRRKDYEGPKLVHIAELWQ